MICSHICYIIFIKDDCNNYVFIKEGEEEKNGGLWELVER